MEEECTCQSDAEWGLVRTTTREKPTIKDYIYDLGECSKCNIAWCMQKLFLFVCMHPMADGSGEGVDVYIIDT